MNEHVAKELTILAIVISVILISTGVVWSVLLPRLQYKQLCTSSLNGDEDNPDYAVAIRGPELFFALGVMTLSVSAMLGSRWWEYHCSRCKQPEPTRNLYTSNEANEARIQEIRCRGNCETARSEEHQSRHLVYGKVASFRGLCARDIGPLTFDIATHSDLAEVAEYRGVIHWHRDLTEKILSVFLAALFSLFLGRMMLYTIDFIKGSIALEKAIETDIHSASLLIAMALIIDGILLIASMTDAPGVSKTLDSLIVVLAGIVIIYFDPIKLVETDIGDLGFLIVIGVAILFLIRWVVRHHTFGELIGRPGFRNQNLVSGTETPAARSGFDSRRGLRRTRERAL